MLFQQINVIPLNSLEKPLKIRNKISWKGKRLKEKGIDVKTGKVIIEIDPFYFRPKEVNYLQGDNSKAKRLLNWRPKTNIDQLVDLMVKHELELHY